LSEKRIPACWKKAKISPPYKRLQAWSQQLPHVGCERDFV
jgi:hypothetical protein